MNATLRRGRPVRRLVVALTVGVIAAACGTHGRAAPPPADARTVGIPSPDGGAPSPSLPSIVDSADGSKVTVEDASRIVSLSGSISEIVWALGLGDRVVGRDVSTTFAEAAEVPVVTRAHDVSAESILALRPTVVLAEVDTGPPEALEQVRSVGVPVVRIGSTIRVDAVGDRIRDVAAALGVASEGAELARRIDAEIRSVKALVPEGDPPTVAFLYLRGRAGVYLIGGPGSGADSMIHTSGGVDAGTSIGLGQAFTPLTSEALVAAAPDIILMTTTGLESVGGLDGLAEIPGVAQTPAGRDRRVVTVEDGLLYSFGVRTPVAVRRLIEQLHGVRTDRPETSGR